MKKSKRRLGLSRDTLLNLVELGMVHGGRITFTKPQSGTDRSSCCNNGSSIGSAVGC